MNPVQRRILDHLGELPLLAPAALAPGQIIVTPNGAEIPIPAPSPYSIWTPIEVIKCLSDIDSLGMKEANQ